MLTFIVIILEEWVTVLAVVLLPHIVMELNPPVLDSRELFTLAPEVVPVNTA